MTEEEVAGMGIETKVIELRYAVGDSVRVISGALAGFVGVVKEISEDKKKIMVLASMFGRETPVELDADSVEKLEI
jgi:transcriptional antiterminator NusG